MLPFSFQFSMHYTNVPVDLWNNGTTILMNIPKGQMLTLDNGKKYALDQYHFHTGSEHTISGVQFRMEMQMVHMLDGKEGLDIEDMLIVSVFFEPNGVENNFLKSFWEFLPDADIQMYFNPSEQVNLNSFSASLAGSSFYSYDGSLTTPPLSENVTWVVSKQPMNCTEEQIDQFIENFGYVGNFRPPQPLSARQIYRAELTPRGTDL